MPQPDISLITTDVVPLGNQDVEVHVLRLDKIHPVISGNKWFKLKHHLQHFHANGFEGIVTFGGAWSNHIVATACMCAMNNIDCVGVIRGERPETLSQTLSVASGYGMKLHFISRSEYAKRNDTLFLNSLRELYPRHYFIPEGGAGTLGEQGVIEMTKDLSLKKFHYIACSIGTGTMFNALKKSMPHAILLGFPALKGYNADDPHIFNEFHFGGYAKYNEELINFMNDLYRNTNIPTDMVYTGKMFYGIVALLSRQFFPKGSTLCCIHSGGLQGNLSLPNGTLMF